ncbi:hypothetical protein [Streptomyces sp. NPDC048349]|uniref:hypothetical protein n=1 Tax=Streptomyces sp. NPDC048349 TaxID=3155486 RepID=UPI003442B19E
MASLVWLLIPLFAAIGAGIWGSWAARDRTQGDISELAGYARFREAMGNSEQAKAKAQVHSGSDAV